MKLRPFPALLSHLLRPGFCRLLPPAARGASDTPPAAGETSPAEPPAGCGWFDSSHDLQCGLSVHEHENPDAVAQDLPLAGWLVLHLARPTAATA